MLDDCTAPAGAPCAGRLAPCSRATADILKVARPMQHTPYSVHSGRVLGPCSVHVCAVQLCVCREEVATVRL